jgi:cysteine-rich repeat protein
VSGAEQCDDMNLINGDGCDNNCTTTACGNGITAGAETCDDSDTDAGDGCSATCTTEAGYDCTGTPSTCITSCGDGVKAGTEACDDSGTAAGDGCSTTCTVETGFTCTGSAPSACSPICGDGLIVTGELCDQGSGNQTGGDGCSAACLVELGYTCMGTPSVCMTTCGDGIKAAAEGCDDSNTGPGDGCSATCTAEFGYTCTGAMPSVCMATCGDGKKAASEACDDSNTMTGDGCNATCGVEAGYTCTGTAPSVCTTTCGDGIKAGAEQCDDMNMADGDCCSSGCQIEAGCELEPNNACGSQNVLPAFAGSPLSTTIKGNINPATDVDFYTFTLPGPGAQSVRVETFFGTPAGCGAVAAKDTHLQLRGTDCTTVLTTNDDIDGLTNWCSAIDGTALSAAKGLAAGTYTVRVARSTLGTQSPVPAYDLRIQILSTCGNGTIEPTEACDDGNVAAGDGCSATCAVEAGFSCSGSPSSCLTIACGNGVVQTGETCDDGNTGAGDGCDATCHLEANFVCVGQPGVCTPFETSCGDALDNDGDGMIDGADDDCIATVNFPACAAGQTRKVFRSTDTPLVIPDNLAAGVTSTINVTGAGTAVRSAMVYNITHTWDADVDMFLTPPGGTATDVCSDNGDDGFDFSRTVLDNTCAVNIGTLTTSDAAPFTGCFKPENPIATAGDGAWTLKLADDANGDIGTLDSWAVILCTTP